MSSHRSLPGPHKPSRNKHSLMKRPWDFAYDASKVYSLGEMLFEYGAEEETYGAAVDSR